MTRGRTKKEEPVTYAPLEIAEYLDDDEVVAEYLSAAASEGDVELFIRALGEVARARGMSDLAKATGLGRESLYKTLSPKAQPRFATIVSVMHALGLGVSIHPVDGRNTCKPAAPQRMPFPPKLRARVAAG
jgi:probable addiction module antidote protein